MDEQRRRIADHLRELRLQHNYSQEYLGETLGKNDYSAYQRLEHGKAELKFADAYKLAKLYKIPMEHIFDPRHREIPPSQLREPKEPYGLKKNQIQITINLDGTEETLERQLTLLRDVNKLVKS